MGQVADSLHQRSLKLAEQCSDTWSRTTVDGRVALESLLQLVADQTDMIEGYETEVDELRQKVDDLRQERDNLVDEAVSSTRLAADKQAIIKEMEASDCRARVKLYALRDGLNAMLNLSR